MTKQEITAVLEVVLGHFDSTTADRCQAALDALEHGIACDYEYVIQYWPERVVVADVLATLHLI